MKGASIALFAQGKRRPAEVTRALDDAIEMWGEGHKASGYAKQIRDKVRDRPQPMHTLPPDSIEGHAPANRPTLRGNN
ncbi:MAG: hypothetical protein V1875_10560 [Candidatus Altiarchaeota archaeon]